MKSHEIASLMREAGYAPISYSGRGMYGRQCVGVEIGRGESEVAMVLETIRKGMSQYADGSGYQLADVFDELAEQLADPSSDNMGLDSIVYWPGLVWTPECDED